MEELKPTDKLMRAWDSGSHITALVRTAEGRRAKRIVKGKYFIIIRDSDYQKNIKLIQRMVDGGHIDRPPVHTKCRRWVRLYCEMKHEGDSLDTDGTQNYKEERFCSKYHIIKMLEAANVKHYEADLNHWKKWVIIDRPPVETEYKTLFYDLETNDENAGSIEVAIGKAEILSFAAVDASTGKTFFYKVKKIFPEVGWEDELKLLCQAYKKVIKDYDILSAWNGAMFDDNVIRNAFSRCEVKIDWRYWFFQDQMVMFQKHGDGLGLTSHAIGNVAMQLLGRDKIDHTGQRIVDLYRNDPEKFKLYNVNDARLQYELEKTYGFNGVHVAIQNIAFQTPDNIMPSRVIDTLVLMKGEDTGYYWPTKVKKEDDGTKFEGAMVLVPQKGYHRNVAVLDFKSLYPSVIQTWNICPSTWISPDKLPLFKKKQIQLNQTPNGEHFRADREGIFPSLFTKITDMRNHYKKLMQDCHDLNSQESKRYECLANAWKRIGLTIYGEMGQKFSRYCNQMVAQSVTLSGQFMLRSTIELSTKHDYMAIYGDSDSLFISMPKDDVLPFLDRTIELYKQIAEKYGVTYAHLLLQFDSYYDQLVLVSKKRYCGICSFYKGAEQGSPTILTAGLESKRTDQMSIVKPKMDKLFEMIFAGEQPEKFSVFIAELRDYIMTGDVQVNEISLSQKITKSPHLYPSPGPHVRLAAKMIGEGRPVWVGQKVEWFPESVDADGKPIPAHVDDYTGHFARQFAWSNKIWPALQRILEIVFPEQNWSRFDAVGKKRNTVMMASLF